MIDCFFYLPICALEMEDINCSAKAEISQSVIFSSLTICPYLAALIVIIKIMPTLVYDKSVHLLKTKVNNLYPESPVFHNRQFQ